MEGERKVGGGLEERMGGRRKGWRRKKGWWGGRKGCGVTPSLPKPLHVGFMVKSLFPHPWKSKRGALTLAVIKLRGSRARWTVSTSIGSHDLWYTLHLVLSLQLST